MRRAVLVMAVLVGCAPVPPPLDNPVSPPGGPVRLPPTPAPDTCGAARIAALTGQSQTVLAAMTFAQPLRIISPGQPVTEDYSAQRLNITLDGRGRITGAWCG